MPLRIGCGCGRVLVVPSKRAGTVVTCPKCKREVKVPTLETAAKKRPTPPPVPTPPPRKPKAKHRSSGAASPAPNPTQPPRTGRPTTTNTPTNRKSGAKPTPKGKRPRWKEGPDAKPKQPQPPAPPKTASKTPTPPTVAAKTKHKNAPSRGKAEQKDKRQPIPAAVGKTAEETSGRQTDSARDHGVVREFLSLFRPGMTRGVEHDRDKRRLVLHLGLSIAATAVVGALPAVLALAEQFGTESFLPTERWIQVLLFITGIQIAYALYLVQLPDWSSVRVVSLVLMLVTAAYAMVLGVAIMSKEQSHIVRALDLIGRLQGGKALSWCFLMLCLTGSVAYFSGRIGVRWYRAERTVHAS